MEPRSLRVPGAHGLSLHLLEWSREGVPLLLVHGFSNEAHIWDDLAPELAPHYRVLALDLRGHGDSDWDPEQRYDYPEHVSDLESVCEHLGIGTGLVDGAALFMAVLQRPGVPSGKVHTPRTPIEDQVSSDQHPFSRQVHGRVSGGMSR